MPRLIPIALVSALLIACTPPAYPAGTLGTADAASHVGESATVCGKVAGTKYADEVNGAPTFINLDAPYPRQVFTALVWGRSRENFASPPEATSGHICVHGRISVHNGVPQIIVNDPSQISRVK